MKKVLLSLIFIAFSSLILGQQDTIRISVSEPLPKTYGEVQNANVNIYPVPVSENSFTIESDKEIASVKITNVIGQDIYRIKYNTPQTISKIFLEDPQRGLYIVTIFFTDESRIVRKIMIERYN